MDFQWHFKSVARCKYEQTDVHEENANALFHFVPQQPVLAEVTVSFAFDFGLISFFLRYFSKYTL